MKYLIYYIFFILIILTSAYLNVINFKKQEQFTPTIREYYRPVVRNVRVTSEGFYNKTSSDISNLFRKFGIM